MKWLPGLFFIIILLSSHAPVYANETEPLPIEIEVHKLINDERANKEKHGLDLVPLKLHSVLIDVARSHSKDMAERGYFDHIDPSGNDAFDRLSNAGVEYQSAGENLFMSSAIGENKEMAQDAVNGWINSPGHYANILTDFTYTGIGYYAKDGFYYLTQVFVTADRAHLEQIGVIYDNDDLNNLAQEENGFFSQYLNQNVIIALIVIAAVLIGIDAQRRNRNYYRKGKRRRRR